MIKEIEIICENLNISKKYPIGTTLKKISKEMNIDSKHQILGALVNNKLKELSYQIYKPKTIRFIDYTDADGSLMYIRSLIFVLYKAVYELFPESKLYVRHPISKGIYCTIEKDDVFVTDFEVNRIKKMMQAIIAQDIPFEREEMPTEKAIELFKKHKHYAKIPLFKTRGNVYTSVYRLGEHIDYFYGVLVPSTGYLNTFDLEQFYNGMLLRFPDIKTPEKLPEKIEQKKLFRIFSEHRRWANILKIKNIGDLNSLSGNGEITELIKISEALHEKKVAQIADKIRKKRKSLRLILISGPSSSGKTTFSKRLAIQLKVNGLNPVKLSLDNYFVNRSDNPIDENGDYDFEALEAIDLKLFNQNLLELFEGEEIEIPKFDFVTGERYYDDEKLSIGKKDILIVEGIHGLNPLLTEYIADSAKYKIYVSAITSIAIDDHNLIKTSDNRLIRRIIRDYKYRNYSAANTISRWPSVRSGEEKNIFPFQENADVMFNSALLYELGVLKNYAEPILREVQPNQREYSKAQTLLKFFDYFLPIG
ncbi:MAG: nucleoside kinase, partial [Bacteroidota bacterium]|nr:nucleoside kinase [Bacteroidota bacterium]